jgi:hypothetical protein
MRTDKNLTCSEWQVEDILSEGETTGEEPKTAPRDSRQKPAAERQIGRGQG